MRLVAEHGGNRVVIAEDVEELLERGDWTVKVENITAILRAVRTGARALLPPERVDPARLEYLGARIRGVAQVAQGLAERHPEDPASATILATIAELHLEQAEDPPAPE
jgi:hypothetical protein